MDPIDVHPNPHFHTSTKGCQIYDIWSSYNRFMKACTKRRCKTHQVNIGRAGWEIGWYLGTQSVIDQEQHNRLKVRAQKAAQVSVRVRIKIKKNESSSPTVIRPSSASGLDE